MAKVKLFVLWRTSKRDGQDVGHRLSNPSLHSLFCARRYRAGQPGVYRQPGTRRDGTSSGDDEFTGHDKSAPTLVAAVFDENVAFTHVSSNPPRYLFLSGTTLPLEEVFLFVPKST